MHGTRPKDRTLGAVARRRLRFVYRGTVMKRARCTRGLFAAFGVVLLLGFTPLIERYPARPIPEPIKLGFSYLSAAQHNELWRLTREYALAEVFLKQCGSPSHVEQRMRLAVRECIEARALNRVAAYFRRQMAELSTKHTFVCDTDQSKALVKAMRAKIDAAVEEVRSMCRSCLFC